jgi:hypothetical protein
MSAAGQYPSNDSPNDPSELRHLNRDAQSPADERTSLLLAQLAAHTAGLRAAARLLGERVENLTRLTANRRAN